MGEFHNLYLQINTLLLADIVENFIKMCLEIYALDLQTFISVPGSAWQVALKGNKVLYKRAINKNWYVINLRIE